MGEARMNSSVGDPLGADFLGYARQLIEGRPIRWQTPPRCGVGKGAGNRHQLFDGVEAPAELRDELRRETAFTALFRLDALEASCDVVGGSRREVSADGFRQPVLGRKAVRGDRVEQDGGGGGD